MRSTCTGAPDLLPALGHAEAGEEPPPPGRERRRIDAEVERFVNLGASKLQVTEDAQFYAVTLLDPKGNEFCAY